MKKKKEPVKPKLTKKEKAKLKKLGELWTLLALETIDRIKPYKCFVIIQDHKGNGISRSSKDFTHFEFDQWAETIKRLKTTTL